jgi:hypothetical protein
MTFSNCVAKNNAFSDFYCQGGSSPILINCQWDQYPMQLDGNGYATIPRGSPWGGGQSCKTAIEQGISKINFFSIYLSLWEYRKILHIEYMSNYSTHQKYLSSSDTRFKSTVFINCNKIENFDGSLNIAIVNDLKKRQGDEANIF